MPTPWPSSPPLPVMAPPNVAGNVVLAPLTACSRLPWRAVARLGEMLITSLRAASASSAAAGTMADSARTDT